jgi:His-Xaa-Ser system protein HxsD
MSSAFAGLVVSNDELGQAVQVTVDTNLYDKAAIFKTAYWTTERGYLFLSRKEGSDDICVEIRKKSEGVDLEQLAREFCNALIDQQTRQIVLHETTDERDILLEKAFAAGRGRLDQNLQS